MLDTCYERSGAVSPRFDLGLLKYAAACCGFHGAFFAASWAALLATLLVAPGPTL